MESTNIARPAEAGESGLFATPDIAHERRPDGAVVLRSARALGAMPRSLGAVLERQAAAEGSRIFLAERDPTSAWRRITYAEAARTANAIAQSLVDRRLGPERPVLILADNGIDHALMMLGAMHVGVPVVPVSTAYARLSQDFGKLRHILGLVEPGLIYLDEAGRYAKALETLGVPPGVEIVASRGSLGGLAHVTPFSALAEVRPTPAVDAAFARVGLDTTAKILFTSGSTGQPKGVINTQRMLCSNQEMIAQAWTFINERPPVLVDWLPWSHTFGGNFNINFVLRNRGTFYIDEGKPALIGRTVANLKEVSPTVYLNVPRGYALLLDRLETDTELQRSFFARLDLLFYAAAALPRTLWVRLEALSLKVLGRKVPFVSSWGMTETAPSATIVHFRLDGPGNVGVPGPGIAVKLVPDADKLEIRVKGPNVTPGYFKAPELNGQLFDAEGWLRTGDAVRLADPDNPAAGLMFDGRVAENFKLLTGTWVNVGMLRPAVIAAGAPVIEDAVVTGHDRDEIGLLIFPSLAGLRSLCPELGPEAALKDLVGRPAVRAALVEGLKCHNAAAGGTATTRIARCLLMTEPPSIDANEITDKGYLNQRAVLTKRAALVEHLHADPAHPDVAVIE
jgi:feruloyl-CoA synthase